MTAVVAPGTGPLLRAMNHNPRPNDQPPDLPFDGLLMPRSEVRTDVPADAPQIESAGSPANVTAGGQDVGQLLAGPLATPSDASPTCTKPVEQRLYAFDELGMFGRSASPQEDAQAGIPATALDGASDALVQDGNAPRLMESGALEGGFAAAPAPEFAVERAPGLVAAQKEQSGRTPLKACPAEWNAGSSCLSVESVPEELGSAPAKLAPRRAPSPPSPVNLLISGADHALQILARSSTAEDKVRLRKLILETTREFGMDVSDVIVNGEATEHVVPSSIGGDNGSRRR